MANANLFTIEQRQAGRERYLIVAEFMLNGRTLSVQCGLFDEPLYALFRV